MDPQNAANPADPNAALMAEIRALKTDINKTIEDKLEEQRTEFDEKFKTVDSINDTLDTARKQQEEVIARQRQQQQPAWVPKDWSEIPQMIDQRAAEIAKKTLEERDNKQTATERRKVEEEAQYEADIDRSLAKLETDGYLPQVYNPNDRNDPGVAARSELLHAAAYMGTLELDKVADTLTQMHRANMVFDPQTQAYISADNTLAPLPGKFAPVGNSSTNSPSRFQGPTTRDLRHSSMDDLVVLAEQRGYGPVPTSVIDQPGGF